MTSDFSTISISSEQKENLLSLGYKTLTPVQQKSLPAILHGDDVIVQAKTGSGKTVAFGLGLLEAINPRFFGAKSLVLCPTRELADQVAKEVRKLARCIPNIKLVVLTGGKPIRNQIDSLEHGAHIIVGTPGRIKDHLDRNNLDIEQLTTLVLDEADRMLDMGFQEDIEHIISYAPEQRQTLLFSATYPDSIKHMCESVLHDPVTIKVDTKHKKNVITEHFFKVANKHREDSLLALFEHYKPDNAVVFCKTKIQCHEVAELLNENRIQALAIHGDLEQRDRDAVLTRFSNNSCAVLVATDVAARGLDIKALKAVINYELPHDAEDYVHRIGRTGRAGEEGLALSLYTDAESNRMKAVESYQNDSVEKVSIDKLKRHPRYSMIAPMVTLHIDTGKKNKIRPGDLLGALTKDAGIAGNTIGKIDIFAKFSTVALERESITKALTYFQNGKVKGRFTRAWLLD
ncbi:MAG: ATP-dependent RNA helicase DbpA [Gammaproteobacteria bacterium]|nr:ATP-dependent RNA helicase DbpA [Gammaproteobacteria bacterium]